MDTTTSPPKVPMRGLVGFCLGFMLGVKFSLVTHCAYLAVIGGMILWYLLYHSGAAPAVPSTH